MSVLLNPINALIDRTCCVCGLLFLGKPGSSKCILCKQADTKYNAKQKRLTGRELTNRELSLCKLVYNDYSNKEIADKLHLAEGTIKEYLHTIMRKLRFDGKSRVSIALWYYKTIILGKSDD